MDLYLRPAILNLCENNGPTTDSVKDLWSDSCCIFITVDWVTNPALKHRTCPHSQDVHVALNAAPINSDTNSDFKCKSTHYILAQRSCDKKALEWRFYFSFWHMNNDAMCALHFTFSTVMTKFQFDMNSFQYKAFYNDIYNELTACHDYKTLDLICLCIE